MTQPPCGGIGPSPRHDLNVEEVASRLGRLPVLSGEEGAHQLAAVGLSVASTPPPPASRACSFPPKTFGVSIRTALPRTRRGSVSPPHVPTAGRSGSLRSPRRAQTPPGARGRRREPSRAGRGTRPPTPRPRPRAAARAGLLSRHLPAARSPQRPRPRPWPRPGRALPPARRALQLRLGPRLVRAAGFSPPAGAARRCSASPPPPHVARAPVPAALPPAAPSAPGAQLILGGGAPGEAAGPPRFPASGDVAPVALTWTTPNPRGPAKSMPR